jgi:glutamyl-tRNA synthetase
MNHAERYHERLMSCEQAVTRLAPSPTGALHLGNARTFLINWALARQRGWRIVMRMEDLDSPRVKRDADRQALEVLQWLGLDWDDGPWYQLTDLSPYRAALDRLAREGLIYPCRCSRSQIAAAQSAPHGDQHELRYPGTCRPEPAVRLPHWDSGTDDEDSIAWRLRVPDEELEFQDAFAGLQQFNTQQLVGDFIVATRRGLPSYQLAVVVDDARQGVTHVVRGDDLLSSTPRQMLLQRLLGLPTPQYLHVPLVLGRDGHRLAKRHGDTRLLSYRQQGVDAPCIIGIIARWCGVGDGDPMSSQQFVEEFNLSRVSHEPVVFTEADEQRLMGTRNR